MSDELLKEVTKEAAAPTGSLAVDMSNPTFGSLLTLVRAVREGKAGEQELDTYDKALEFKLRLARHQLGSYELPEALQAMAGPAIGLAMGLMARMEDTLLLLRQYRAAPSPALLDEAELRLQRVHATMRNAFASFAPMAKASPPESKTP